MKISHLLEIKDVYLNYLVLAGDNEDITIEVPDWESYSVGDSYLYSFENVTEIISNEDTHTTTIVDLSSEI